MGTQKKIAEVIIEKEVDDVLALKENQKTLHDNVELFFDSILRDKITDIKIQTITNHDKGHGRIETRKYFLVNENSWLDNKDVWENIKYIGMVQRKRIVGDKETFGRSYYIRSLESMELFSNAVS